MLLAEPESLLADILHGGAVGKQPDLLKAHALAGSERLLHGVGIMRFDADHLDVGAQTLDIGGDAGDQPAAANGTEDRMDRLRVLAENFHADGALSGDHIGIVKRMHEGHLLLLFQLARMGIGPVERIAGENHLAATASHRIHLDCRRRCRHDDHRTTTDFRRRQGNPLRVITGRSANNAALESFRRQPRQLVVGTAQLERKHRLHILALEQNRIADSRREIRRRIERRFHGNVVDLRGKYLFKVIGMHGGLKLAGKTTILAVA